MGENKLNEEYWRTKLTPEEYAVLRQSKTEIPFSGELLHHNEKGMYTCKACGQELFSSDHKFESGSGWPSFNDVVNAEHVRLVEDLSHGMVRTEVRCANCDSHLGHVWKEPRGDYYCINSVCLNFKSAEVTN